MLNVEVRPSEGCVLHEEQVWGYMDTSPLKDQMMCTLTENMSGCGSVNIFVSEYGIGLYFVLVWGQWLILSTSNFDAPGRNKQKNENF